MNTDSSTSKPPTVKLEHYRPLGYSPGAGSIVRGLWYITNVLIFMSPLFPFYSPKRAILRTFGASIGHGVVIKPRVNIKHPWRLTIGQHSWLGEGVWIDNLAEVIIGNNVCISQEAYLLTGNHDYKSQSFTLITQPIRIQDGTWIGAKGIVCPGVTVATNSVLTVGSVLTRDTESNGIYSGNPARCVKSRIIKDTGP